MVTTVPPAVGPLAGEMVATAGTALRVAWAVLVTKKPPNRKMMANSVVDL
jgi:hypothetical protein